MNRRIVILAVLTAMLCALPISAIVIDESDAAVVDREYDFNVSLQPGETYKSETTVGYRTDRAAWDYEYVDIIDDDGCSSLYISKERGDAADVYYLCGIINDPGQYDVVVQNLSDADPTQYRDTYTFHFDVSASGSGDEDLTIYAYLHLDAGEAGTWDLESEAVKTGTSWDATFDLSAINPVLPGYDFAGWSDSPGGSVIATDRYVFEDPTAVDNTRTLYAVFDEIVVPEGKVLLMVYFDSTGGSSTSSMKAYVDEGGSHVFELSGRSSERDGYTFEGWSLSRDSYDTVDSVTVTDDGVGYVTVYAVWSEASPAVPLDFLSDLLSIISDPMVLGLIFLMTFAIAYLVRIRKMGEW